MLNYVLKIEWFLSILFGSLITMWMIHSFDMLNNVESGQANQMARRLEEEFDPVIDTNKLNETEETSELSKSNQQTIERINCSSGGFDDETIIQLNSDPLPNRTFTYENETGICAGNDTENCVPKFVRTEELPWFFTSKPTKTVSCLVRKSMSRVMKSISCLLNDPLKFFFSGSDLIEDAYGSGCAHTFDSRYRGTSELLKENIKLETGWSYLMIIRDPIERFLSGYTHLCLFGRLENCQHRCNGCGANLTCFLQEETKKIWKMSKTGRQLDTETDHLSPQNWQVIRTKFCELGDYFSNYTFLRYNSNSEKFYNDELKPFLKSRNVSADALEYIGRRMIETRTPHSTAGFKLKSFLMERILNSSYLLEMLIRLYYHDYQAFNFPLPEIPNELN